MMRRRWLHTPLLLDRYWTALRASDAATSPAGLDPELSEQTERLARLGDRLGPTATFAADLRQRLATAEPGQDEPRAWRTPAIQRRKPASPTHSVERPETEDIDMANIPSAGDAPVPLIRPRWQREWAKLVAAFLVFLVIGALLVLVFRDRNDPQPSVLAAPTATPTTTSAVTPTAMEPVTTATVAAVVPPAATSTHPPPTATATVELPPADVQATITVGRIAGDMVAGAGAIWVSDAEAGKILRIDPSTNEVVAQIDAFAQSIAFDGSLWAIHETGSDASLLQIDPATNTVVATIPLPGVGPGSTRGLAAGAGSIWISMPVPVSDQAVPSVVRVDPVSQTIVATITSIGAFGSVATDDAVWVADIQSNTLVRIDPATNEIVARIAVGGGPTSVEVGAGSVWVTNQESGSVSRIDPATNEVIATINLGPFHLDALEHPVGIAIDEHGVWVTDGEMPRLYQIDPATNAVVATLKANASNGIVASDGSLWLRSGRTNTLVRVNPAP